MLRLQGDEIYWYYNVTGSATGFAAINSTALNVVADTWYEFHARRSGSSMEVYVEGASVASTTEGTAFFNASHVLRVGASETGSSDEFFGKIADVQIFNSAQSITPTTSKPAVTTEDFYLEHDITNTTFTDVTSTHTANITNTAVRHTLSDAKFGGSSGQYNGSADLTIVDTASAGDFDLGASGTIDTFISFDALGSAECIMMTGDETSDHSWKLFKNSSDEFVFECSDNTTQTSYNTTLTTTSAGLSAQTMHHVRVVVAGASSVIYVDSTSRATGAIGTIDAASNGTLYVGKNSGGTERFTGRLEETSVAPSVERTSTEPAAPYELGVTDIELDSITFTAGTAPTKATMVVVMEPIDSVTINTDFIGYISPTASFANKGTFTLTYAGVDPLSGGNIYTSDDLDLTGLTSGTSIRYYLRGANTKDLRVHATYIYYAS
jgi:hypothetical protein